MNHALMNDVRFGFRVLRKQWSFSSTVITTLAIGIFPVIVAFGAINAALIAPLPYKTEARLFLIEERNINSGSEQIRISYPEFVDLHNASQSLEDISAFSSAVATVTGRGEPERVPALMVSPNSFNLLGVRPIIGRAFSDADGAQVVMLGYDIWNRLFDKNPAVLGQALTVNDANFTIIGVMPSNFHLPLQNEQLWMPLAPNPALKMARQSHWVYCLGVVKPGSTAQQVQSELDVLSHRLEAEFPATNRGWVLRATGLRSFMTKDIKPTLLLIFGFCVFLLLVSCINVANLLLARSTVRRAEISTRIAVGASRIRILQQLLAESFLLAGMACLVGVVLGGIGIHFVNLYGPARLSNINPVHLDFRVMLFAIGAMVLTVFVFGLMPAMRASRISLAAAISEAGRSNSGDIKQQRLWNSLVIIEAALSVAVMIGAALLARTAVLVDQVDIGLESSNLLTAQLSMPFARYRGGAAVISAYNSILDRLAASPDVQSAGAINDLPIAGSSQTTNVSVTEDDKTDRTRRPALAHVVTPDLFRTLGIPLLSGRGFSAADMEGAPKVAIVNREFAEKNLGIGNVIGKHLSAEDLCAPQACEIVGVVGNVRSVAPEVAPTAEIYVPLAQNWWGTMTIIVRSKNDSSNLVPEVRRAVAAVDNKLALGKIDSMSDIVARATTTRRMSAFTLSLIALVALGLAAVGIYGTLSYFVHHRQRELGIRMALGAPRRRIRNWILQKGMKLALTGIILGLTLAVVSARVLVSFLFGISSLDPLSYGLAAAILLTVAFLASLLPAVRASRAEVVAALREE